MNIESRKPDSEPVIVDNQKWKSELGPEVMEYKELIDLPERRRERMISAIKVFGFLFGEEKDPTEDIDPVEGLRMLEDAEDIMNQIHFDNSEISTLPDVFLRKESSATINLLPQSILSIKGMPKGYDVEAVKILIDVYYSAKKIEKAEGDLLIKLGEKYHQELAGLGVEFNEIDKSKIGFKNIDIEYFEEFLKKRTNPELTARKNELLDQLESKETPESLREFPENIMLDILDNVFAVELNQGCTVRCTFCAFGTSGNITDVIPFKDVVWLLRRIKSSNLYYASDPLDYRDRSGGKERTFADALAVALAGNDSIFTSTAYPSKSGDVLSRVKDKLSRLSVSMMNKKRLAKDGILKITENGSIIITDPDLAYTWMREPIYNKGNFEMVSDGSKERLSLIFGGAIFHDEKSLVRSGRNVIKPHEEGHANGDFVADSISCHDGVVACDNGVKNNVRLFSTNDYPNGVVEVKITKEGLSDGILKLEKIIERIESGEDVAITELLKHCVIKSSRARSLERPHSGLASDVLKKSQIKDTVSRIGFVAYSNGLNKGVNGTIELSSLTGLVKRIII